MKAKSKGFNPNYEIISLKDPTSIVSECYRRVKVSLDNLSIDKKIQVIQFCSSTKNEGKSSCCVNTAACYVEAGQKVLIAYFIDMLDDWSKNSVWFMIDQKGWKYQIFLFYDNECNHAQGEDL